MQKPSWLRVRAPTGERYDALKSLIQNKRLHTVCASASCPNIGECWQRGTATFMLMGNTCTRACRFCHVDSSRRPAPLDASEAARLAESVALMQLRHVVLTSVTRDDLKDGGAQHFYDCITAIKTRCPSTTIEVLVPDFQGDEASVDVVTAAPIVVYNHNLETSRRLTPKIRSGAKYDRSLGTLRHVKKTAPKLYTKTGMMVGLGETHEEILETIYDAREAQIDIFTLGQYLRPAPFYHPVVRYAHPDEFADYKNYALKLGFKHVESGPLVRSSYQAEEPIR